MPAWSFPVCSTAWNSDFTRLRSVVPPRTSTTVRADLPGLDRRDLTRHVGAV
jgi:hypothetical protein